MASKFKDPLLRELQSNNLFTIGGMASLIGSSYSTVWNLFDNFAGHSTKMGIHLHK